MARTSRYGSVWFTVMPVPGAEILTFCKDVCEMSTLLNVGIVTTFNGGLIVVRPGSDYKEVAPEWARARDASLSVDSL